MLETNRLLIQPLTYNQLLKYVRNDGSLEEELNLNKASTVISAELKEALEHTILPNVADADKNYLYSTLWTVIFKEQRRMVGDLCFFGEPNAAGEIEIGYGTYEEYRNRGFMTEAIGVMTTWAASQPNVKSIIAASDKRNIASSSVLERNSFAKYGETETLFSWRLKLG